MPSAIDDAAVYELAVDSDEDDDDDDVGILDYETEQSGSGDWRRGAFLDVAEARWSPGRPTPMLLNTWRFRQSSDDVASVTTHYAVFASSSTSLRSMTSVFTSFLLAQLTSSVISRTASFVS